MIKEELTISKIIAEIKLCDSKIEKFSITGIPVVQKRSGNLITSVKTTEEEFTKLVKSYNDGLHGQFIRKFALKAALIKTNATRSFDFEGETLTIAEAITRKDYYAKELRVYRNLYGQYITHSKKVTQLNESLEYEVQSHLTNMFGGEVAKKNTPNVVDEANHYRDARGVHLFDPTDYAAKLPAIIEKLETFFSGIDTRLSEVNALTKVEVEY